jgi:hypothetical protein
VAAGCKSQSDSILKPDAILAEIRRVREAYAEQFAGDVRAMLADLQRRQEQGGRKVVARSPKRIKTPSSPVNGGR